MHKIFIKNNFCALLLIALLVIASLAAVVPGAQGAVIFSDIQNHWARNNIQEMADQGRLKGYGDGTFQPDRVITRAEFAHLIVDSLGLSEINGKGFEDTVGHWAEKSIKTASEHGIIDGYNQSKFGPDDFITREQAAVILVKALGITAGNGQDFVDIGAVSYWALDAVKCASTHGILSGYPDGSFKPKANVTRAQAAVILQRSMELMGNIPAEPKEEAVYTSPVVLLAPPAIPSTEGGGGGGGGGGGAVTPTSYTLSVVASPENGGSVNGGGSYIEGAIVTVSATANSGYSLHNWTVNGMEVSTDPTFDCVIPAADVTLVANFTVNPVSYTLTLQASPGDGGTVSDNSGGGPYEAGTEVNVTAAAAEGYSFSNWSVNGTVVSTTAVYVYSMPAANTTLVANFTVNPVSYTLTLQASPGDGGTVSDNSGGGPYEAGTEVNVTAAAAEGYSFGSWSVNGTVVSTAAVYVYSMPAANTTLVANFTEDPVVPDKYTLTLQANPGDGGTVSDNSGGGPYEAGTEVNVTAAAAEGYSFGSWSVNGTVVSTAAVYVYSMPAANTTLVANFTEDPVVPETYTLTLQANPGDGGTVSDDTGAGPYEAGDSVDVSAEAAEGYTFDSWTVDGEEVSTNESFSYIMPDADTTLVANFTEDPVEPEKYTLTLQANPGDGGTVSDDTDAGPYEAGDSVDVTAEAAEGYSFSSWTVDGEEVSTNASFSYTMPNADTNLVADFTEDPVE